MSVVPALMGICALLAATPAAADEVHHAGPIDDAHIGPDHYQIDTVRFDVHTSIDPHGIFGVGNRVEFALAPNGFIPGKVRDEFAMTIGADVFFVPVPFDPHRYDYDGSAYVVPIVAVQWNFYVGRWSFFPEAGVALHVGFDKDGWHDRRGKRHDWLYPEPNLGFGTRFHFSKRTALLMRAGTPGGFQVGLIF